MKKILAILLAAFVVLSCFAACGNNTPDNSPSSTVTEDGRMKVPEEDIEGIEYGSFAKFNAVDFEGKVYDESIFKGKKLTMINIWATFCRPCINEMPDLELLSKAYAEEDFQLIGIACDVTYDDEGYYDKALLNKAIEIADEITEVTYLNLLPSRSLDSIKLESVYSVPETIFVDENGNIVDRSYIGSRSYEDWKAIVDSILARM